MEIMKIVVPDIITMRKTMAGPTARIMIRVIATTIKLTTIMTRVIATTIKLTTMTITMANKMVEVIQP